jgi:hypothetical protein
MQWRPTLLAEVDVAGAAWRNCCGRRVGRTDARSEPATRRAERPTAAAPRFPRDKGHRRPAPDESAPGQGYRQCRRAAPRFAPASHHVGAAEIEQLWQHQTASCGGAAQQTRQGSVVLHAAPREGATSVALKREWPGRLAGFQAAPAQFRLERAPFVYGSGLGGLTRAFGGATTTHVWALRVNKPVSLRPERNHPRQARDQAAGRLTLPAAREFRL